MTRAVGIDIGNRAIKVVELTGSGKGFRVQRVVVRDIPLTPAEPVEGELPPDPDLAISEVLRDVFDSLKLPRDDVCASLDAGSTVFREIMVPFRDEDQIRKVVKFEAENHLHSHAIDDVVVNWVKTGENRDGSRLTIFASPKERLTRLLKILYAAGIEPASIDLDATALYTACEAAGIFEAIPNVVLIDIGARSTSLILITGGRPLTLRSFLLGTDQIGAKVGKELHLTPSEAARRVQEGSGPRADDLLVPLSSLAPEEEEGDKSLVQIESEAVDDQRRTFVRKLHRESMRSLASLRADASPDRILLTGGGSLLPGLLEDLGERFGLPVERLDLADRVDWKDRGTDHEFTEAAAPPAIGCALRLFGHNPLGIELLQDEFAPTNRFDVLKNALAVFVPLLFVAIGLLALVTTQQRDTEQRRYQYVTGRAVSLYRIAEKAYLEKVENKPEDEARAIIDKTLRRAPTDHTRAQWIRKRLLRRYNKLQSELGLRHDIPPVHSSLKVWVEIIRALNRRPRAEYGARLRILKMSIKQRSATVRIEVNEQAVFDKIREQFQNSPYFRARARTSRVVEVGAMQNVKGHWQRDFDFRFKEDD